ncbi:MAG: antibiotic biosynthesis monooxygenase family protein [Gammaproteobacteria bacterium]
MTDMYIAMNRFNVARGQEGVFEEHWRNRESYLSETPGFIAFHLLRNESGENTTLFISHSQWQSEQAFIAWTESEAFKKAHRQAKMPPGVLAGPPHFEGFNSVDLTPVKREAL